MGDAGRLDCAYLLDVEVADVLQQPRAGTKQDRDQVQPELIDQPGGQVLLDDAGPAGQQDIPAARGLPDLLEGGLGSVGDEEEGGAARHLQRLAGVAGDTKTGAWNGGPRPTSPSRPILAPEAGPAPNMLQPITVAPTPARGSWSATIAPAVIQLGLPLDPKGSATVVAIGHLLRYADVRRPVQAREVSA